MKICEVISTPIYTSDVTEDIDGDGIIAYHGSPVKINRFHGLSHFGTKAAARSRLAQRGGIGYIHLVKLKITNPLRVNDNEASDEAALLSSVIRGRYPDLDRDLMRSEGVVVALRAAGYDGLVYNNRFEDRGKLSYVVLGPEQVKILDTITKSK
jgi:hypothetical protein